MFQLSSLFLLLIPCLLWAQSYQGQDQNALFEAGAGIVYGSVAHYPGSDQSTSLVLPFPAIIYRGERYRLDEDGGARTRFFYSDWMEINLSIGGSLPVSAKDNRVRRGMPKLDTIAEVGPGLIFHFFNKRNSDNLKLSLNLPVRQAISSDLKYTKARGQVFNPLLYSFYDLTKNLSIFTGLSVFFATKEYHRYLYDVPSKFVTSERPFYQSQGGHVVTNYGIALIYGKGNWSTFGAFSLNDASQNANRSSPLYVKSTNNAFAFGVTYYFYKIP